MTKFIWFFGPTAVGKETLINDIANNPNHFLIAELELEQPIIVHEEALVLRHGERDQLVEQILRDREKAKTILLKGQGHDVWKRTYLKLEQLVPDDEILYLYLDASPEVIRQRRQKRGSPIEGWDDVHDRNANLKSTLDMEKTGTNILWFDNNGNSPVRLDRPQDM
ncbi:MAG TPA: hypothetical protein VLF90_01070 [Patescibacteria group bacterium]|nr:hypothetical protein [Patescibacteria group bacterium]